MSNPPISYTPHTNTAPEVELNALASIYALILQKHQARHRSTRPGGPDARKENLHDLGNVSIPRAS